VELSRLSKLNPLPPLKNKRDRKGKEKVEPSEERTQKRQIILVKNTKSLPLPKYQTTIEESLKRAIEMEPISSIKVGEVDEVNKEEGGLIKKKKRAKGYVGGSSLGETGN
ncbi:Hypothetical predicted protein, partial [Olea europaea subsp. europaea]